MEKRAVWREKTRNAITWRWIQCVLQLHWINVPSPSVSCLALKPINNEKRLWTKDLLNCLNEVPLGCKKKKKKVELCGAYFQCPEWIRGPILPASQSLSYFVRINSTDWKNRQKTNCVMIKVRKQDVPNSFSHPVIGELRRKRQGAEKEERMRDVCLPAFCSTKAPDVAKHQLIVFVK